MKKILVFFALLAIAIGCERVDFDLPENSEEVTEANSQLRIKAAGYSSGASAEIYVEQDVMTGIKVESKDSANPVISASWTIEEKSYNGLNVSHKFINLGERDVVISARFQNNVIETRTFKVQVVKDLSAVGPVVIKVKKISNSSYDVWIGWDKRWLKSYPDGDWSVIGDATKWTKVSLPASSNYNLDSSGNPIPITDTGKYIGVWVNIKEAGYNKIALIAKNGSWVNISGSPYAKSEDIGMVHFQVNSDGTVTSKGDGGDITPPSESLPGQNGDNYFRFDQTPNADGKINIFFRLDSVWTNKSFSIRGFDGGDFGLPVQLASVTNFPNWGKIEVTYSSLLDNVSSWRYGQDITKANEYVSNMNKSVFYDATFKSLRLQLASLQAIKRK